MGNNSISLSGNLTREPELRAVPGPDRKFVLNFRVAVDKAGGKDQSGKEEAGFFDCVAWGDLAENLARSLSKGQRVMVSGELRHRSFEANDGTKRTAIEVLVDDAGPSLLWAQAQVRKVAPVRQAS